MHFDKILCGVQFPLFLGELGSCVALRRGPDSGSTDGNLRAFRELKAADFRIRAASAINNLRFMEVG